MSFDAPGKAPGRPPRLLRVLRLVEDGLLVFVLSAMIALSGAQILLRNVWQAGFTWGDPLLRVMVLWIALLGAMAATRDDKHITIDILSRHLSAKGRLFSRLLTDAFTSVVCGLLAYHGARFVILEYEVEAMAFSRVPAWVCELIIPIGFTVITLRFACAVFLGLRRLAGGAQ
ncbi:MAG: TRAP transporter small permease [Pseudomonadota bacterium]